MINIGSIFQIGASGSNGDNAREIGSTSSEENSANTSSNLTLSLLTVSHNEEQFNSDGGNEDALKGSIEVFTEERVPKKPYDTHDSLLLPPSIDRSNSKLTDSGNTMGDEISLSLPVKMEDSDSDNESKPLKNYLDSVPCSSSSSGNNEMESDHSLLGGKEQIDNQKSIFEFEEDDYIEWQQLKSSHSAVYGLLGDPIDRIEGFSDSLDLTLVDQMSDRMSFEELENLKSNNSDLTGALNLVMQDVRRLGISEPNEKAEKIISPKPKSRKKKVPKSNETVPTSPSDIATQITSSESITNSEGRLNSLENSSKESDICSTNGLSDEAEIIPLTALAEKSEDSNDYPTIRPTICQPGRLVVDMDDDYRSCGSVVIDHDNSTPGPIFGENGPFKNLEQRLHSPEQHTSYSPVHMEFETELSETETLKKDDEIHSQIEINDVTSKSKPRIRKKVQDPSKCANFLNKSYDQSLSSDFVVLVSDFDLGSIESCCQELVKLRKVAALRQAKLYHSIAQGKVLTNLKKFTENDKHLDNILKSRDIQLESTQRNNYSKLYRFYLKYNEICNYNTSSSYVIKNYPMVKRVFEEGLVIT